LSTPIATLFPYTTLFRSPSLRHDHQPALVAPAFRSGRFARPAPSTHSQGHLRQPAFARRLRGHRPVLPAADARPGPAGGFADRTDRKSTRLNSSHEWISY